MIEIEVEDSAWLRSLPHVAELARAAAAAALEGWDGEDLVILLADDEAVRDLNTRFRGKDAATNVLSFPAAANTGGHLGDIALASGVCAREASEQGKPLADHLRHLVIHGVLHLLGYDHLDDAEAERMEALERDLLAGLGVADPYAFGDDVQHTR
jgi:probable rRNA maturation factor